VPHRTITLDRPLDLAGTVAALVRGPSDPTTRLHEREIFRALRTPSGPATLLLRLRDRCTVDAQAEGAGATEALEIDAPGLVGAGDDPGALRPKPGVLADLVHRRPGLRLTRAAVMPALIAAILEQKVTGREARRAWRRLVLATSDPAPGDRGLWLPPDPARIAATAYFAFHTFGVERRRAEVIRSLCERAGRIDRMAIESPQRLSAWLGRMPGVGPWTVAEVARLGLGDPDAVSVGDFHLPNLVGWVLAGEARSDDAHMLALLEPYRGQRGRVQLVIEASGIRPPAFGPRMESRSIAGI
jgi:3-methyladenine DNA glycosylase/8-oxoguanine DNA glycosylase